MGEVRRLGQDDVMTARELNGLFCRAFEDPDNYPSNEPGEAYLQRVLGNDSVIVLVSFKKEKVIGGQDELPDRAHGGPYGGRSDRDARCAGRGASGNGEGGRDKGFPVD